MLDFPNSPTTGQTFTAGGDTWTWDGTKWTGSGGSGGTTSGVPEAPTDGRQYGRQSSAWTTISTSTGGGGIPEAPLTGQTYGRNNAAWVVVTSGGGGATTIPNPLDVTGSGAANFTGSHDAAGASIFLNKAASGKQSNIAGTNSGKLRWQIVLGNQGAESGSNTGSGFDLISFNDAGSSIGIPLQVDRATSAFIVNGIGASSPSGGFTTGGANVVINKAGSGHLGQLNYMNNGSFRWQVGSNANPESGANAGSGFFIQNFNDSGGAIALPLQISRATSAVTFSQPIVNGSDRRIKKNVEPVTDALTIVSKMQGIFYELKNDRGNTRRHVGLIAQDVIDTLPEVVFEAMPQPDDPRDEKEPILGIAYPQIVAVLINAINELSAKVAALEGAGVAR